MATSSLAAASWAGLHPPAVGSWSGPATIVSDPQQVGSALRLDLRLEGKRVEAWARGSPAGALRSLLAGERVWVEGTLRPIADGAAHLAARHVGGRMSVTQARFTGAGSLLDQVANRFRRSLVAGASSLSAQSRSLFTGFVIGDNRGQPAEVVHDFRASGLTHLLVVSGQNVAFVLGLAAPVLTRLGRRGRLAVAVGVLVVFGTVTRWDSSVLRAVGMTTVSLVALASGRPSSARRTLALTVTVLLLVDPLLVHSLGFALSVAASAGLVLLARPLAEAIGGPRWLAGGLATTLAAQAGVAPVLIPIFGGIPVVGVAANLLAVPVAGPLMTWGLTAGTAAGALGGWAAWVLHLPTRLAVGWEAGVARMAAAAPLGTLEWPHTLAAAAGMALALWSWRQRRSGLRNLALVATAMALAIPAVAGTGGDPRLQTSELARGATLWQVERANVLVLDGHRGQPQWLLGRLHRQGVSRLTAVVATRGTRAEAATATVLSRRVKVDALLGPAGHSLGLAATTVDRPLTLAAGRMRLQIEPGRDRLAVTVEGPG